MSTHKLDDCMTVPFSPLAIYSPIPNHKGLTEKNFVDLLPGRLHTYLLLLFGCALGISPEDEILIGNG